MSHHQQVSPIRGQGGVAAKPGATLQEPFLGFLGLGPPVFAEIAELEIRPPLGEPRTRRTDVAGKARAFAHQGIHAHGQADVIGDDLGGFEGSRVRACDDPANLVSGQGLADGFGLANALFGQAGVDKARILVGNLVDHVEMGLGVAKEDHRGSLRSSSPRSRAPPSSVTSR